METNENLMNADVIIEGIAFKALVDKNSKRILANDLYNPNYKASFVAQNNELLMSASSFREEKREHALIEAVKINQHLLIETVLNA